MCPVFRHSRGCARQHAIAYHFQDEPQSQILTADDRSRPASGFFQHVEPDQQTVADGMYQALCQDRGKQREKPAAEQETWNLIVEGPARLSKSVGCQVILPLLEEARHVPEKQGRLLGYRDVSAASRIIVANVCNIYHTIRVLGKDVWHRAGCRANECIASTAKLSCSASVLFTPDNARGRCCLGS